MAPSTGTLCWLASWAVAKAPMAANTPWHSEMVPPTPVVSTIDSMITARHTPATTRPSQ